jgi:hypothetical protein
VERRVVVALLALGLIARVATVRSSLFEHHSWRQAATAGIAKNFARDRLNPLYPQVEERGAQTHGYLETCLELDAFLIGLAWSAVGISVPAGRLLNALLSVVSGILLWQFVKRRYDAETARAALFVYAVGFPLVVWIERAYLNEPVLLLLTFASFRATQGYLDRPSLGALAALIGATMLIAMVKPPHLIVWGPMGALFLEADGARALRRWEPYAIATAGAVAVVAWYTHAAALKQMTGLAYPLRDKLFDGTLLASPAFRSRIAETITFDLVGPPGLALGVVGLWLCVRRRRWFEVFGVLSFMVYLVIVAKGNYAHDYYQSALAPVWTVLVACGATEMLRGARRRWNLGPGVYAAVVCVLALAMAGWTLRRSIRSPLYRVDHAREEMCRALVPNLAGPDLLLTIGDGAPDLLFCVDHRGWALPPDESTGEAIHRAWVEGADDPCCACQVLAPGPRARNSRRGRADRKEPDTFRVPTDHALAEFEGWTAGGPRPGRYLPRAKAMNGRRHSPLEIARTVLVGGLCGLFCLAAAPAWSAPARKPAQKHTQKHARKWHRPHPARIHQAPVQRARSASRVIPEVAPALSYLSIGGLAQCGLAPIPISFTQFRLSPMPEASIERTQQLVPQESEAVASATGTGVTESMAEESEPLRFIGLVEAPSGALRVAVLRVNGRVVYGREGEVVAGRYRLLGFSDEAAQVFDLSASVRRTLALGLQ